LINVVMTDSKKYKFTLFIHVRNAERR